MFYLASPHSSQSIVLASPRSSQTIVLGSPHSSQSGAPGPLFYTQEPLFESSGRLFCVPRTSPGGRRPTDGGRSPTNWGYGGVAPTSRGGSGGGSPPRCRPGKPPKLRQVMRRDRMRVCVHECERVQVCLRKEGEPPHSFVCRFSSSAASQASLLHV